MKKILLILLALSLGYSCSKENTTESVKSSSLTTTSIKFENNVLTQFTEPILSVINNTSSIYNNYNGSFYSININIEPIYYNENIDVYIFEQSIINSVSKRYYIGSFLTINSPMINIYYNGSLGDLNLYYQPNTKYYILLSNK